LGCILEGFWGWDKWNRGNNVSCLPDVLQDLADPITDEQ
jgi:hypothetical protein